MIDPADLRFLHLEATPWLGIRNGEMLDDLNDFGASGDTEFPQPEVGVVGGLGGFGHTVENTTLTG